MLFYNTAILLIKIDLYIKNKKIIKGRLFVLNLVTCYSKNA